jgi:hypothetical protein
MRRQVGMAGVAVLAALAVGGCGSQAQPPARRAAAYIGQVNRIESQLAVPLHAVTRTSGATAGRSGQAGVAGRQAAARTEAASLATSLARIEALRGRLAALPAPAAAHRLRGLLLELVDQQAHLTEETAQLIVFLPVFHDALRPLGPDTVRLRRVLAISQASGAAAVQAVYAEKATALRAFRTALERILSRLSRVRPPVVSRPEYRAQVDSLQGMSGAAGRLAAAVSAADNAGIARQLAAFDRAAAVARSAAEQRSLLAADRAYNAQVARVQTLTAAAEQERLRLAQTLN